MSDKRHHEMTPVEKIGYMQQKMATAKSFESPVLTVPIADLEIVMAALEEKDQSIAELNVKLFDQSILLDAAISRAEAAGRREEHLKADVAVLTQRNKELESDVRVADGIIANHQELNAELEQHREQNLSIKTNLVNTIKEMRAATEAMPVGSFHICDQQVEATTDYVKDGEWPIDNGELLVYAAPPAPAVPDFGALTKLIVGRLIDCGTANDDSIADAEVFVYNACRAAMLQPVSEPYKLPAELPPHENESYGSEDDCYKAGKVDGWNEYRAAMLAAAPTPTKAVNHGND